MKILICIDDTDNRESKGTGHLALRYAQEIEKNGWGIAEPISRHQLFVHPEIPYTSHNSAMCFGVETTASSLERIIEFGGRFLSANSAPGSDPGLCVAVLNRLENKPRLIEFGLQAKKKVLAKDEAYELAAREPGVHLSEHGGTGSGVIGALAGVGLRLSGNDGRFKGKYYPDRKGEILSVETILSQTNIQEVREENGRVLGKEEKIMLGEKVKSVLLDGKIVLLVEKNAGAPGTARWITLGREKIRKY
ncbi:MAG: hypothetical protein GX890_06670 [Firmicutes bacterium]|nr:hypothetical protein [Bacillota bacterium]HPU00765.1 hypothetical protein [Bacillota bacterium]